jgi:hypothetical protein
MMKQSWPSPRRAANIEDYIFSTDRFRVDVSRVEY